METIAIIMPLNQHYSKFFLVFGKKFFCISSVRSGMFVEIDTDNRISSPIGAACNRMFET